MQLAQINIARLKAPLDDPALADFVTALDPINELAERAPGFVWRLAGQSGNATDVPYDDDPRVIVNMSVWASLEALRDFTYTGPHLAFVKRRREWFEKVEVFLAMWWVRDGQRPTVGEGRVRLQHLAAYGPTLHAFTFARAYEADGRLAPTREWPAHALRGGPPAGEE